MEVSHLATEVNLLAGSLGQLPEPVARPVLVAVSGLPGTRKSYFCAKLAERLPFVVLESDALRKVLFPLPSYDPNESSRLFRAVYSLVEQLLRKGIPVIFDATNLSEQHREYIYNIADRLGVKLILVHIEAPPEVVRRRLKSRAENLSSKSDADWMIYQQMKPLAQRIRRRHYAVDTSRDIGPVLDRIVKEISRSSVTVSDNR